MNISINISETEAKTLVMAMRQSVRFAYKGIHNTEELFRMTQVELNEIYKSLTADRKALGNGDTLLPGESTTPLIDFKIEIVRIIYMLKDSELVADQKAKEAKEQKAKLLELIQKKRDNALVEMPLEELEKMYGTL